MPEKDVRVGMAEWVLFITNLAVPWLNKSAVVTCVCNMSDNLVVLELTVDDLYGPVIQLAFKYNTSQMESLVPVSRLQSLKRKNT